MRLIPVLAASAALLAAAHVEAQRPDNGRNRGENPGQAERGNQDRAQRRRAEPLSMDKLTAAWQSQAGIVATTLELDGEQTEAIAKAYVTARTSQRMALAGAEAPRAGDAARGNARGNAEGERPDRAERDARRAEAQRLAQERREQQQQVRIAEREKLEADLAMVLEGQKLRYATEVLGGFDPRWDQMTSALIGFELANDVQHASLKLTENYIVETRTAREAAALGAEGAEEAMSGARERLLAGVKGFLTDEQYVAFERTVGGDRARRARGQDGQGRGGNMAERMMEMDADGDGRLSRDEVPERMAERFFGFLDADDDGFITVEEMEAAAERRRERGGNGGNRQRGGGGGGN